MNSDGRGNAPYPGSPHGYPQQPYAQQPYAPQGNVQAGRPRAMHPGAPGYGPPHAYPQQAPYGAPPPYAQQPYAPPYPQPYAHAPPSHPHAGHAHYGAPTTPLACPQCGEVTSSLKHYTMMRYLVFVWFFAFWARKTETGCPGCMRKAIAISAAINLVPANLLWLFVIAPWYSVLFFMTFADGHSAQVQAILRE